jgi:NAD(P)-dependent dehydrogenase (short-subunit alcohol dehydrogenase family)
MSVEEYQAAALENTYEQWDDCFRTNITGMWFSVMACLDLLDAGNKKGPFSQQGIRSQVVINSSVGGFLRGYGSGFP